VSNAPAIASAAGRLTIPACSVFVAALLFARLELFADWLDRR
jgi:hypothetical protein